MKLKINNKTIKVNKVDGFINRYKILKFDLHPLKEIILFEKRKFLSTYFFCQRVDVVMTDKDNMIIYIYENVKSEKRIHYKRKVYNTYILPAKMAKYLNSGEKLNIINKK